jgi:uncharacterized protein
MSFPCDRCGLCCRRLAGHALYQDLDRGDGVCRHFDEELKGCRIYEDRPLHCRIEESYERYFRHALDRETYISVNIEACNALKTEAGLPLLIMSPSTPTEI